MMLILAKRGFDSEPNNAGDTMKRTSRSLEVPDVEIGRQEKRRHVCLWELERTQRRVSQLLAVFGDKLASTGQLKFSAQKTKVNRGE